MTIEDALAPWLGSQRWFAGKGMGPRDLAIVADTELVAGDPELRHLIVAVSHGTTVDYYQILVGLRRKLPARLKHVRIGPGRRRRGRRRGGRRRAWPCRQDRLRRAARRGPDQAAAGRRSRPTPSLGDAAACARSRARTSRPTWTASPSPPSSPTPAWSSATSRYSRCSAGCRPGPTRTLRSPPRSTASARRRWPSRSGGSRPGWRACPPAWRSCRGTCGWPPTAGRSPRPACATCTRAATCARRTAAWRLLG